MDDLPADALKTDLLSAIALIALSGVALVWLIPTQISTQAGEYDLSPSFFPSVGVWIVLTLSVLLLMVRALEFWQTLRQRKGNQILGPKAVNVSVRAIAIEFFAWTVAGSVFVCLLPMAGFLPLGILVVIVGTRVCGRRDWLPGIALGGLFCWLVQAGAWSLFTVALP